MNCAYRLIWNEQLNAWVVAPEIASARGKRGRGRRSAAALLLTLVIGSHAALAADLAATALPGGGQISAGQATISSTGAAMTINQGSQRAIINWQNFDIGSQASVNFQQPNNSAVTLNRAGGATASRIEGQLTANGQVFLVNPNGMLFGGGARVNASAFVASTLNIRDDDFLAGNYIFTGTGGSIDNQGKISAAPG
ncbi:MAG: filamentous hemagglutinin N-terminal domain-containing protein, partial [Azonexus sp.]